MDNALSNSSASSSQWPACTSSATNGGLVEASNPAGPAVGRSGIPHDVA